MSKKEETAKRSRRKQRKLRKTKLVAIKGGKCERCNGIFHPSVYDFHHRNPDEKEFNINTTTVCGTSWDALLIEVAKCALLCANCHREVHMFLDQRFLDNISDEDVRNAL